MYKISFIITVYNKSKYIADVIRAIKRQNTSSSCEYIFINDGSLDDSLDIIRRETRDWSDCLIVDQENSGVVASTIKGIELSRGKYIKFVDGDDQLLPSTVQVQEHLLDKNSRLAYVSCSVGVLTNGIIKPKFQINRLFSDETLSNNDMLVLSGEDALLSAMIRNRNFPEFLTGNSTGMSRKSSINLDLAKAIASKYKIRQMQDHLLSAVSLLNNDDSCQLIKRIGEIELSKSSRDEISHSLSSNTENARQETMLINHAIKEFLSPKKQLALKANDLRPLYRATRGKPTLKEKINPLSFYNRVRSASKEIEEKKVGELYEKMIAELIQKRQSAPPAV